MIRGDASRATPTQKNPSPDPRSTKTSAEAACSARKATTSGSYTPISFGREVVGVAERLRPGYFSPWNAPRFTSKPCVFTYFVVGLPNGLVSRHSHRGRSDRYQYISSE